MKKNININFKIFISIAFALFIMLVLPGVSYGARDYCEITIGDKKIKYDNNGATYTITDKVDYGEKLTIHIHQGAMGIGAIDKVECWTDENQSSNIKSAKYRNITVDTDWVDEVDFYIDVQFKEQTNTDATLWFWFGDKDGKKFNLIMKFYNISDTKYKKKQQEQVKKDLESQKRVEGNKIAAWEEYYKKDLSELDQAYEKLYYLKSILYKDSQNGNNELWNKFVSDTTAQQRRNWYRDITYNIRDVDDGIQSAIDALATQIEVDEGEATQESLDQALDEARTGSTKCV